MGTKGFVIKNGILEEYTAKGGDVVIPSGVTGILGTAFFKKGSAVTSVSIPDSVVSIGLGAFDCMNLAEIRVDPGNHHFASDNGVLFNKDKTKLIRFPENSPVTEYVIPDRVTTLVENPFDHCKNLKSLTISDSVTEMEDFQLFECKNLEFVRLPKHLHKIYEYMFYNCKQLKTVIIQDEVERIEENAFTHCKSLTSLKLPDSLTYIGTFAFNQCGLKEIEIPDSVKYIDFGAFDDILEKFTRFQITCSVSNAFDWSQAECLAELLRDFLNHPEKFCDDLKQHMESLIWIDIANFKKVLDTGKIFTQENIDTVIQLAIQNRCYEHQMLLTDYKYQHFGFDETGENLKL